MYTFVFVSKASIKVRLGTMKISPQYFSHTATMRADLTKLVGEMRRHGGGDFWLRPTSIITPLAPIRVAWYFEFYHTFFRKMSKKMCQHISREARNNTNISVNRSSPQTVLTGQSLASASQELLFREFLNSTSLSQIIEPS
jgi:hypothetical protein